MSIPEVPRPAMPSTAATRTEHDELGPIEVPIDAPWGPQTQRAIENFDISGVRMDRAIIRWIALVKLAAATVSGHSPAVPEVDRAMADVIVRVAGEVAEGGWPDAFPVDVFQTGSGTSTNMNVNEVIARRAAALLGRPVHPNDHVNACQSSNDVVPTAIRLATAEAVRDELLPAIAELERVLLAAAVRFDDVVKPGRTHLMDAAPLFLGQEFEGYAGQIEFARQILADCIGPLGQVPIGGSAVGTGLNVPDGWAGEVRNVLTDRTGLPVTAPANRFAVQHGEEVLADVSGRLRVLAGALTKICNDLRLLNSGPHTGLGEIRLPAIQPGSSIMPGKVNPVIPEAVLQVAARVFGNDVTIGIAVANGTLELNTYLPVIGATLLESVRLLTGACRSLSGRCIEGITADAVRSRQLAEASPSMAAAASVEVGHEHVARAVRRSLEGGVTLRDALAAEGVTDDVLSRVLDPVRLARGGRAIEGD